MLNAFEVKRLVAFKYEDIVSNNFDGLIDVLDPSQVRSLSVTLGHHNLRKSSNGKVETAYVISVVDVLRAFLKMTGADKLRIFGSIKKVINPIVVFFVSFTLYRAKIEMPNPNDLNILRRSLADDNETLNQVFNISY